MCYVVNPLYIFKQIPADVIKISISYIQDSNPVTETHQLFHLILSYQYLMNPALYFLEV